MRLCMHHTDLGIELSKPYVQLLSSKYFILSVCVAVVYTLSWMCVWRLYDTLSLLAFARWQFV